MPLSLPADRPRPHGHILPACGEGQLSSLTGMKQQNPSIQVRCSAGAGCVTSSPGPTMTLLKALPWRDRGPSLASTSARS